MFVCYKLYPPNADANAMLCISILLTSHLAAMVSPHQLLPEFILSQLHTSAQMSLCET